MKSSAYFRSDHFHGRGAKLNELKKVFATREKSIRERVRQDHAPHVEFLRKKGITLDNIREASGRRVATGALAGLMAISPVSTMAQVVPSADASYHGASQSASVQAAEDYTQKLAAKLKPIVPAGYANLTSDQEQQVSQVLAEVFNIKASAELEGHRLNRTFGLIGAEQHLYRYPGDNIFEHATNSTEMKMFGGAGIAPGLGAYGYWARSKAALTPEMIEQEKWYVVAQTFLAPGFREDVRGTVNFFKYRKFIVVNPDTGQAVVGDLGDSGPGEHTGKSFGGSPEVMHNLGYGAGPRKGRVIFYFLDDPGNQIPLGPISTPVGGAK